MQVSVLTPMTNPKSSGCGCLSGGCAIALLVLLLLGGALFWGAWSTYQGIRSMTSATARTVPIFNATQEQWDQARAKCQAFAKAYESGQEAQLILTTDEINTLIAREPDWSALKGRVFVTLHQTRMAAQIGIPLSQIRTFENRHFNGEVSMAFVTEEGKPRPVSINVKANGNEFPSWLIRYLTSKDFVENLNLPSGPARETIFTHLLSLEVKDSLLVIRAKKEVP